jgi:hypothetical protein
MKCKICEEDLQEVNCPSVILSINIPFTKLSFELWNWGHKEFQCMSCANEAEKQDMNG